MFAAALNKGSRGGISVLAGIFGVCFFLSLFASRDLESDNYPNLFYNYFAQKVNSRLVIVLLNYLFIAAGAVLVSLIAMNQEVVDKQNYFPVFVFLLLSVSAVQPGQIAPQALSNVLILFAMLRLLDTYRKEDVLNQVFEAAFILSACGFVTISSILTFPLFFIVIVILRPFNWREWVVSLIGFISPLFIYECVAYLSDFNQWYFLEATRDFFSHIKIPSFSEYYLPILILLIFLLFFSLVKGFLAGFGNTVKKQRTRSVLLWYLLLTSFGFLFGSGNSSHMILSWAFPLSFFIGDFLFGLRQLKVANTLVVLFVMCVILIFLAQLNLL